MKSTGRTPYEVRLELLQLAFDILTKKYEFNLKYGAIAAASVPTSEEVMVEAEKMNVFISKATQSH